jgi:hypothetical protein
VSAISCIIIIIIIAFRTDNILLRLQLAPRRLDRFDRLIIDVLPAVLMANNSTMSFDNVRYIRIPDDQNLT